jgi:hypothetical protein
MVADDKSFRWCEASAGDRKVPVWARSAALAPDGAVFVPAAITGLEMDVILSAGYDGVTIVRYRKHAYVPVDWLRREYPKVADLATKIELSVREYFA